MVRFLIDNGIDSARLIPKGYGEERPRILDQYVKVNDSVFFEIGSELNTGFIESLPTEEAKELAHQLNRRIEFAVVSKDYKPKTEVVEEQVEETYEGEIKEIIPLISQYGKFFGEVNINGHNLRLL